MFKSYSSSFSYSNDGKNQVQQYHSNYKDYEKEFNKGFKRDSNLETEDKEEMFYKTKQHENDSRKLFGKSKNNQDWTVKRFMNQEEFEPETQPYQSNSEMFSRLNSLSFNRNQIQEQYTPLPSISNEPQQSYTPPPILNYMGDYHEDNNINILPDRPRVQLEDIDTPMPRMADSIVGSRAFRQVSRNFNQFQDQFNDPFFQN
jgi:hypothetical protein